MNLTQLFTLLLLLVNIEKSYSQSFGQSACQMYPCENNGACVDVTYQTRSCNCMLGYAGTDCQYDTNACQPQPCENDGTCSSSLIMKPYVDFTIEIPSEFCWNRQIVSGWTMGGTKEQCYEAVKLNKNAGGGCFGRTFLYYATTGSCACGTDACDSRQDQAAGWTTYMQESLEEESTCTCPQYFTGQNCETSLPTPCTNNPCQNSGVCNLDSSGYTCDCPTGYDGVVCQFDIDACDPDLCKNGATCMSVIPQGSNVATHTCACPTGYTGTNCEEDINECDPDPCNSGVCSESGTDASILPGEYNCECSPGFVGDDCITYDGMCPQSCEMYEECTESVYTRCGPLYDNRKCNGFWNQTFCNENNGWCGSTDAHEAGSTGTYDYDPDNAETVLGLGEFTCTCPTGYTGTDCEEDIDECDLDPCQNGATCKDSTTDNLVQLGNYLCDCLTGFVGTNCDIDIDACDPNLCENGGVCNSQIVVGGSEYTCDCPTGYTGTNCEQDVNECDPDPCQNGATCSDSITDGGVELGNYSCDCLDGFSGANCDECGLGKGLDSDGKCNECEQPQINNVITSTAPCADQECPAGFGVSSDNWVSSGGNCEECPAGQESPAGSGVCTNIDECSPDPCQNGATCIDSINEYTCDCPTGYDGVVCQFDIDACDPNLCENGGVCNSQINQYGSSEYTCDCPTGYNGTNCEQDINECDPDPCQNNATCTEGIGEYTCDCLPGYTGTDCEEDINKCDPDPCQNNATCTEDIGEYTCDCLPGYTGTNCEQGLCDPNPCLYNSVCTQVNGTHICECPPGHAGPHCELNVAIGCDSVPCQHGGTCSNGGGADYTCNCSITGYNGTNCEIEVVDDLCDPNPCLGEANRCTQDKGTYICECPPGHTGINCELHTELGCDAEPCKNNGTCGNLAGDGFTCKCSHLFTGKRCESDANTENTATNIILICLLIILVIIISVSCGIICCGDASAAEVVTPVQKLGQEPLLNTIKIIF